MTDPINKTGCVALYAARIHYYASEIVRTHDFGGEAGLDEEPWGIAYQRNAAKIYAENLPHEYLTRLANVFAGCAQTMDAQLTPPERLSDDWSIVQNYFSNGATGIAETLDVHLTPGWEDPEDQTPTTPAAVRFDILATYVEPRAARRLGQAGRSVSAALSGKAALLTEPEQLRILKALVSGDSLIRIANDLGYSERTLYRRLNEIYGAMGVTNREQAIALAAMDGTDFVW